MCTGTTEISCTQCAIGLIIHNGMCYEECPDGLLLAYSGDKCVSYCYGGDT